MILYRNVRIIYRVVRITGQMRVESARRGFRTALQLVLILSYITVIIQFTYGIPVFLLSYYLYNG